MRLHPITIVALFLFSAPAVADEKGEAMVKKWLATVPGLSPVALETTTTYTYGKWSAVFKDKTTFGPPRGYGYHRLARVDAEFPRDLFTEPLESNINPIPHHPDSLRVFSQASPAEYLGRQTIDGVSYDVVQVNELIFQRNSPPSRMIETLRREKDNTLAVKWYFDAGGTLRRIGVEGVPRVPDVKAVAGVFMSGTAVKALAGPAPPAEKLTVTMTVDVLRKPRTLPARAALPDSPLTVPVSISSGVREWAFSPDSKLLAIAGSNRLELFRTVTGKRHSAVEGSAEARLVSFSSDGKLLAFAAADGMHIVRAGDGTTVKVVATDKRSVSAMRLSPDGATFATTSGGPEVEIWSVAEGTVQRRLAHSAPARAVLYSQDGTRLVSESLDAELLIWDTRTWTVVQRLPVRDFSSGPIAMSRDGKTVATVRDDSVVVLWDAATGRPVKELKGAAGSISFLEFSMDGRTLSAIDCDERDDSPQWTPGTIRWSIATGMVTADYAAWRPQRPTEFRTGGIVSPDGRLAAFLDQPNAIDTVKLVGLPGAR